MSHPTLTTERLILRRPKGDDWPHWHQFMLSERSKGVGGPSTAGKAWRGLAAEIGHWDMRGFGMFMITEKSDDTALGMVGPWFPVGWPEREIGWMMFTNAHEGKGYAHEAAQAVLEHVFSDLGWDTIVSYIVPDNTRSIALAQRLGARLDPDACPPSDVKPCLVYRHPRPLTTGARP